MSVVKQKLRRSTHGSDAELTTKPITTDSEYMLLEFLPHFDQTPAKKPRREVLRALRLPMPADVEQQFIQDHGNDARFLAEYGRLDLHAIAWERVVLPASTLIAASIKESCEQYLHGIRDDLRRYGLGYWEMHNVRAGDVAAWRSDGTWARSPIFLDEALLGADRQEGLHLVEGHTRLGALWGLILRGEIDPQSTHEIWLGSASDIKGDCHCGDVLRQHRLPFRQWLKAGIGGDGMRREIADLVVRAEAEHRSKGLPSGNSLTDVLIIARVSPPLAARIRDIETLYAQWDAESNALVTRLTESH